MEMPAFFRVLEPYLIWFYWITGYAWVDFSLGTFMLALIAVTLGEFTISLAFLAVRQHIDQSTGDAVRYQNLSVDALAANYLATRLAREKKPFDRSKSCATVKQYFALLDRDPPPGVLAMDDVRHVLEKGNNPPACGPIYLMLPALLEGFQGLDNRGEEFAFLWGQDLGLHP